MENINMNGLKIENMNNAGVANAPTDTTEIKTEVEDTLKDTQESTKETTQEDKTEATQKHIITYIGSGEYKDSTGHKWHKNDEKTYDESEYITRKDLHFMINYGEMKHTVVTM